CGAPGGSNISMGRAAGSSAPAAFSTMVLPTASLVQPAGAGGGIGDCAFATVTNARNNAKLNTMRLFMVSLTRSPSIQYARNHRRQVYCVIAPLPTAFQW